MEKPIKLICCTLLVLLLCTTFFLFDLRVLVKSELNMDTSPPIITPQKKVDIVIFAVSGWSPLCTTKPNPIIKDNGCVDVCTAKGPNCNLVINCHVISPQSSTNESDKADVLVNHFGPNVPIRKLNGPPYLTVFHKGESNTNQGLDTLQTYPMFDRIISFQRYHSAYFTYGHSHQNDFLNILALNNNGTGTTKESLWLNWKNRLPAIAVFVSNCMYQRSYVIKMLSMFYKVHSFGNCAKNRNVPDKCQNLPWYKLKKCVLRNYKYTLTMENTKEPEYVTEKVYDVLLAGSVPLYWGAPNVAEFLPNGRKSFIEIDKYLPVDIREGMSELKNKTALSALKKMSDRLREMEIEKETITQLQQWQLAREDKEWGEDFCKVLYHEDPICSMWVEAYNKKIKINV